jgi:hypothetical protein
MTIESLTHDAIPELSRDPYLVQIRDKINEIITLANSVPTGDLLWDDNGSGSISPSDGNAIAASRVRVEIVVGTITNLTAAQCRGTFVTNNQAPGEIKPRLYALSEGSQVTFLVEATQTIEVNPPAGEALNLDGTLLDADDCINSPAVTGSKMVCTRMKNAAGAWKWSCDTARGAWVDHGASD